ncbi:MAG: VWA domain-containing protein [Labilithrix sp.]|nr:VWA domain-containing protein [Labilithrix sp.]MCW5814138.1 VWA domain-containing protein [Labilithrix sp.]
MIRPRVRLWALLAGPAVVVACGARTGLGFELAPDDDTDTMDATARLDARAEIDAGIVTCVDGRFPLRRASPAVMFVLDRSLSMRQSLAGASRWQTLRSSLAAALPPVDDTMELGALVYPISNGGAQSCVVPGAPDLFPTFRNVDALIDLLDANGPRGSTPTADAIDSAATALYGFRAASRARAMVLATDGEPTCNPSLDGDTCDCVDGRCRGNPRGCLDDARTADRLAFHRDRGLPTYVIGIQDANNSRLVSVLNRLADAGGRARNGARRYYEATSQAQLTLALSTIRDQVSACTYLTTSVPTENGSISLLLDGLPIDGADWSWSNRANGEILFAGTACDVARDAVLEVDVRCDVRDE